MSSLLPPNATDTERALESATERTTDLPVPIRDLHDPYTCPVDLLPWLAWAKSVDTWKSYWPEGVKRARIAASADVHRRKGTAGAVRTVVESFGAGIALREWWQLDPQGEPHTFEVTVTTGSIALDSAEYQQDIIDEITRVKPLRSHFTFVAGLSAEGGMGLGGIVRTASYARLSLTEKPWQGGMGFQGAARPVTYTRLTVQEA